MIAALKRWWRGGDKPFTVAVDYSRLRGADREHNRELLLRVTGIRTARRVARRWVRQHACGQARVLEGWHYWPDER